MSHSPSITIAGRRVSRAVPPFTIAEIGINHGGSIARALELVEAAAEAGAHAVKLQTIVADQLVAPSCPAPAHVSASRLAEFFQQFELDEAAHHEVAAHVRRCRLTLMSTPFSLGAVDLLERVGVDAYKIASGDLTWDQLIAKCAATTKPLVLSTGMATLAEVQHAIAVARGAGATGIAVLHCVSAYPVPPGSENLLALRTLASSCDVPVGFSDHGADTLAAPLAVALGAALYERHITLAGDVAAVDAAVSSTPAELASTIEGMRRAWMALGTGHKACIAAEAVNVRASRRSLCAARDLPAGATITAADLIALRPATGIAPAGLPAIEGRILMRAVPRGAPLEWADFDAAARAEDHRVA